MVALGGHDQFCGTSVVVKLVHVVWPKCFVTQTLICLEQSSTFHQTWVRPPFPSRPTHTKCEPLVRRSTSSSGARNPPSHSHTCLSRIFSRCAAADPCASAGGKSGNDHRPAASPSFRVRNILDRSGSRTQGLDDTVVPCFCDAHVLAP